MGKQFMVECNKCQTVYSVREGGGRDFYLLHCDVCGKEKIVRQKEVIEKIAQQDPKLTLNQKVEAIAGKCKNGYYRINAKARCPKCFSDDYSKVLGSNNTVKISFYD